VAPLPAASLFLNQRYRHYSVTPGGAMWDDLTSEAEDGLIEAVRALQCLGRNCDAAVFAPGSTTTVVPIVTRL